MLSAADSDGDRGEYRVRFANGSLLLGSDIGSRHFAAVSCVALQLREQCLWLLPLRQGAGGQLLKWSSARGDRALPLAAQLRDWGIDEQRLGECPACWDKQALGLCIQLPPTTEAKSGQ